MLDSLGLINGTWIFFAGYDVSSVTSSLKIASHNSRTPSQFNWLQINLRSNWSLESNDAAEWSKVFLTNIEIVNATANEFELHKSTQINCIQNSKSFQSAWRFWTIITNFYLRANLAKLCLFVAYFKCHCVFWLNISWISPLCASAILCLRKCSKSKTTAKLNWIFIVVAILNRFRNFVNWPSSIVRNFLFMLIIGPFLGRYRIVSDRQPANYAPRFGALINWPLLVEHFHYASYQINTLMQRNNQTK